MLRLFPDIVPPARSSVPFVLALVVLSAAASAAPNATVPRLAGNLASCGQWTTLYPNTATLARYSTRGVYDPLRDRMILFGGSDDTGKHNDIWALRLDDPSAWTRVTPSGSPPDPRDAYSAIYDPMRDRVVYFGGNAGRWPFENDVWVLWLATMTWEKLTPTGFPPPRAHASAAYDGTRDRMIVFGGTSDVDVLNDVWELTFAPAPKWSRLSPSGAAPSARFGHSAIYDAPRDRMVVFGGLDGTGGTRNDIHVLTFAGAPAWSGLTPTGAVPPPRTGHSAVFDAARDRMLVFAGATSDPVVDGVGDGDVWALDLGGQPSWTRVSPAGAAPPQMAYGAAIYDSTRQRVVSFGGIGTASHQLWRVSLSQAVPEWKRLATTRPKSYGAAGVYDAVRQRLVVFGGFSQWGLESDAWSYDLSNDSGWALMIPAGPRPASRYLPTAVLDPVRNRMIVFGGSGYNDTWALPLAGAPDWVELHPSGTPPVERAGHTAIYDPVRDRMLVFGGRTRTGPSNDLNDLWALSLSGRGAWTRLVPSGPPPGGYPCPAIYDPRRDRMLVCGHVPDYVHGTLRAAVWAFSLDGEEAWSQITEADAAAPGRIYAAAYDRALDCLVGFDDFGRAWRLALAEGQPSRWTQVDGTMPGVRGEFVAVNDEANNRILIQGGRVETESGGEFNDVVALSFPANRRALMVDATPAGAGMVTRHPESGCYPSGATVTLTATPMQGFRFSGWGGDVPTAMANPLSVTIDRNKTVVARFDSVTTTALLAQFEASARAEGIELRWRFWTPDLIAVFAVHRAEHLNGPWGTTALETHDEAGTTVGLDRDAAPGHTYFYRLGASLRNGSPIVFGPISATAERKIARSAIILIGPNPSAGATEIQFAIAGGGNVGMSVVDVAGRLVAKLVEGNYSPGRYSVAWDGAGTSHRLPAGIYFVRLVTRDRVVSRKLAIVR